MLAQFVSLGVLVKGGTDGLRRPVTGAESGGLPHSQRGLWVALIKATIPSLGGPCSAPQGSNPEGMSWDKQWSPASPAETVSHWLIFFRVLTQGQRRGLCSQLGLFVWFSL